MYIPPLTTYDLETIRLTLDIEQALKLNPNATFSKGLLEVVMHAIESTVSPYADVFCKSLEVERGNLFPVFDVEIKIDDYCDGFRERAIRANDLVEEGTNCAFKSFDEIRTYINDWRETLPLEYLLEVYESQNLSIEEIEELENEAFEVESEDLEEIEDLEIEIEELETMKEEYPNLWGMSETAAVSCFQPQSETKTEKKSIKNAFKNIIEKTKNLKKCLTIN